MRAFRHFEIEAKPVSVNQAFQGRRFKTKACKDFEQEIWHQLPQVEKMKGEVELMLEFYLKNYRRTDLSNLVKILEDVIVKKGLIEDDRKVMEMHLYKYPVEDKDKIRITILKHEATD